MPLSSSTINMLAISASGSLARLGGNSDFGSGEANQEPRAGGNVVFHANGAIVFGDDAAGDRQTQTGSARLGRKVREEELFLVLRRNSAAAVGDLNDNGIAVAFRAGGYAQPADWRAFHGFRRVIYQVRHDLANQFGVRFHRRKRARKIG